jgi:preprotein translocase subunit SecY
MGLSLFNTSLVWMNLLNQCLPISKISTIGTDMIAFKWTGTGICLLSILLTALNIYPANLILGFIGSAIWATAGYSLDDTPLFVVEIVAVIFYAAGIVLYVAEQLSKWGIW